MVTQLPSVFFFPCIILNRFQHRWIFWRFRRFLRFLLCRKISRISLRACGWAIRGNRGEPSFSKAFQRYPVVLQLPSVVFFSFAQLQTVINFRTFTLCFSIPGNFCWFSQELSMFLSFSRNFAYYFQVLKYLRTNDGNVVFVLRTLSMLKFCKC